MAVPASAPDRLWVGDITHLPTREGPLLFATSSMRIAAASSGGRWTTTSAWNWPSGRWRWPCSSAAPSRSDPASRSRQPIHRRSLPGKSGDSENPAQHESAGLPYDNAMAESFFASFKLESTRAATKPGKQQDERSSSIWRSSTTACACTRHSVTGRHYRQNKSINGLNLYPDYLSVKPGALHSDPKRYA